MPLIPRVLVQWQEPPWFRNQRDQRARDPNFRRNVHLLGILIGLLLLLGTRDRNQDEPIPAILPPPLLIPICLAGGFATSWGLVWLSPRLPSHGTLWANYLRLGSRTIKLSQLAAFSFVQTPEGTVLLALPHQQEAMASGLPAPEISSRLESELHRLGLPHIAWPHPWQAALPTTPQRRIHRGLVLLLTLWFLLIGIGAGLGLLMVHTYQSDLESLQQTEEELNRLLRSPINQENPRERSERVQELRLRLADPFPTVSLASKWFPKTLAATFIIWAGLSFVVLSRMSRPSGPPTWRLQLEPPQPPP